MAHETLKFKVHLDDNENWQPITGSKHYGTFYMLYIKIKNTFENDLGKYYCCDFKLQNYKGAITLGLSESYLTLYVLEEKTLKANEDEIKKKIKNFNNKSNDEQEKALKEHSYNCKLSISIEPFSLIEELICSTNPSEKPKYRQKIIKPLGPIKEDIKGMTLETEILRENPNSDFSKTKDPLDSIYLNPYIYERSGDDLIEITKKGENGAIVSPKTGGTLLGPCNPSRSLLI